MSEVFKEYLIKQKKSPIDTITQAGIIIATVVLCAIALILGSVLGPLIGAGIIWGAITLFSKFNKEYEYILTNNELDIDVIYNRNSRKRVITIDMKKIDMMASIKDERYTNQLDKPGLKLINASDNAKEENTYIIIADTEKHGNCKIMISPNSELLNELYKQAPSKVFRANQ